MGYRHDPVQTPAPPRYDHRAEAQFDMGVTGDLLTRVATYMREADVQLAEAPGQLSLTLAQGDVVLSTSDEVLDMQIAALDGIALQLARDYMAYVLDFLLPGLAAKAVWKGEIRRNTTPLNFATAQVVSCTRVAPRFLRITLACDDTLRLAEGRGMHFSLLVPPEGRAPVWPRLDDSGRTVCADGADLLHRAAYTFVDLDPVAGRFTFDIFEHEGGHTTEWARRAQAGDIVGITGPGSGDFPAGRDVLMAGDETALPALRRILEHSPVDRRGDVLIEVGHPEDILDLPHPPGILLHWVVRARGETLWDRLSVMDAPEGPDRHVWVAGEQDLVRKARARFRREQGVGASEGYFANYWAS